MWGPTDTECRIIVYQSFGAQWHQRHFVVVKFAVDFLVGWFFADPIRRFVVGSGSVPPRGGYHPRVGADWSCWLWQGQNKMLFESCNHASSGIDPVIVGWDKVDAHMVVLDVCFDGLGTFIVHYVEPGCIPTGGVFFTGSALQYHLHHLQLK